MGWDGGLGWDDRLGWDGVQGCDDGLGYWIERAGPMETRMHIMISSFWSKSTTSRKVSLDIRRP
jgi:hypothetical protein